MEYLLIESHSNEGLTKTINSYINEGWQPIGGAATYTFHLPKHPNNVFFCYTQGIVRHEKPEGARKKKG